MYLLTWYIPLQSYNNKFVATSPRLKKTYGGWQAKEGFIRAPREITVTELVCILQSVKWLQIMVYGGERPFGQEVKRE